MLPGRILFNNLFDDFKDMKESDDMMKCDIYEDNGEYVIEMDMPGYKKEDIKMEFESGYLIINAKREFDDTKKYIRRERKVYESLTRKFYVGDIKDDDINAKYNDGVLTVKVKESKQEQEKSRLINID